MENVIGMGKWSDRSLNVVVNSMPLMSSPSINLIISTSRSHLLPMPRSTIWDHLFSLRSCVWASEVGRWVFTLLVAIFWSRCSMNHIAYLALPSVEWSGKLLVLLAGSHDVPKMGCSRKINFDFSAWWWKLFWQRRDPFGYPIWNLIKIEMGSHATIAIIIIVKIIIIIQWFRWLWRNQRQRERHFRVQSWCVCLPRILLRHSWWCFACFPALLNPLGSYPQLIEPTSCCGSKRHIFEWEVNNQKLTNKIGKWTTIGRVYGHVKQCSLSLWPMQD